MSVTLFALIATLGLGAALAAYRAWRSGKGNFLASQNLMILMNYANDVILTVEQEFRNSELPQDQKDAARKARAVQLMQAYAKELGFTITPELIELVAASIEAAIKRNKTLQNYGI